MATTQNKEPWVIPHDIGTFLVRSRTVPNTHHIVDYSEQTCSCDDWQFRAPKAHGYLCWHIRYINHLLQL